MWHCRHPNPETHYTTTQYPRVEAVLIYKSEKCLKRSFRSGCRDILRPLWELVRVNKTDPPGFVWDKIKDGWRQPHTVYGHNLSWDISMLPVLGGFFWYDHSMTIFVGESACAPPAHTIWAISFVKLIEPATSLNSQAHFFDSTRGHRKDHWDKMSARCCLCQAAREP